MVIGASRIRSEKPIKEWYKEGYARCLEGKIVEVRPCGEDGEGYDGKRVYVGDCAGSRSVGLIP